MTRSHVSTQQSLFTADSPKMFVKHVLFTNVRYTGMFHNYSTITSRIWNVLFKVPRIKMMVILNLL